MAKILVLLMLTLCMMIAINNPAAQAATDSSMEVFDVDIGEVAMVMADNTHSPPMPATMGSQSSQLIVLIYVKKRSITTANAASDVTVLVNNYFTGPYNDRPIAVITRHNSVALSDDVNAIICGTLHSRGHLTMNQKFV